MGRKERERNSVMKGIEKKKKVGGYEKGGEEGIYDVLKMSEIVVFKNMIVKIFVGREK